MQTQNYTFEKPHRPLNVKLLNWTGKALSSMGINLEKFDEESLLKEAIKKTNLSDFGDDEFREPLQILVKSLEEEANLNFFGHQAMKMTLVQRLANRLRIKEHLKKHPEIEEIPIKRPIFIVGLPKTGTTPLHRLLTQDPASRWLRFWEIYNPIPPEGVDSRLQEAEKTIDGYLQLMPQLPIHYDITADGPDECNVLFEYDMIGLLFETLNDIKSYGDWIRYKDLTNSYRFYRQQLQLLSSFWSESHWLLKAPFHLLYLDNLLTVFPDACIVHTHRDPQKVVPACSSSLALERSAFSDVVNLKDIGEMSLEYCSSAVEKAMKVRDTANNAQFYDVYFHDFIQNPIGTVRQIYDYFNYEFTDTFDNNLKTWLNNNPRHKHGVHRYSLEQFQLKPEKVKEKFANYYDRFDIKMEN